MWSGWLISVASVVLAYGLGSVPTGYLAGRWLKGIDIREAGSGSTGATNVLRVLGKKPAAVVLAIDISKGAIAVLLAGAIAQWTLAQPFPLPTNLDALTWQSALEVISGLTAVIGHSKPVWLGFRGGKSVATGIGTIAALSWVVALITIAVFALVLSLSRIVSLSSVSGAIAVPIAMIATGQPLPYCLFGIATGVYVIWRHRSNLERLIAGIEPRLGESTPSSQA